ncbi:MAG: shikimate dehydrogenase [Lachnospiraceae bacterium]|nr:shikimate dehydrogenase [Lachnospiraceae bacterium]
MNNAVKGTTAVCGLLGNPVSHSVSPQIHNTLAQDLGQNLVYVPLAVADPGLLGDAVRGAFATGVTGLNVTVPYKNAVIPFLEAVDPLAAQIGAVNTLVRGTGGYLGCNTDVTGLRRSMEQASVPLRGRHVVLLGAGGAARAAGFLCAAEGAESLTIVNRTAERARQLSADIGHWYPAVKLRAGALRELSDLLPDDGCITIQCTSAGLYPRVEEDPLAGADGAEELLARTDFAFDVIYRPRETLFLRRVREHGGRTMNGLVMLLYQGIEAFEKWTGCQVDDAEAKKVLGELSLIV